MIEFNHTTELRGAHIYFVHKWDVVMNNHKQPPSYANP